MTAKTDKNRLILRVPLLPKNAAGKRVNSVGKALYDLYGSVGIHYLNFPSHPNCSTLTRILAQIMAAPTM